MRGSRAPGNEGCSRGQTIGTGFLPHNSPGVTCRNVKNLNFADMRNNGPHPSGQASFLRNNADEANRKVNGSNIAYPFYFNFCEFFFKLFSNN